MEMMENNELPFLDTKLVINGSSVDLQFYSKPNASPILQNFVKNVGPKTQKLGLLSGEINRVLNTTSTPKFREEGLKRLKVRFLKNQYPKTLIEKKIQEFREKNFIPTPRAVDYSAKKHIFVQIDYTSERCTKIGHKIKNILHSITPNFEVTIAYKTIKLEGVIFRRLKEPIPMLEKSGLVYTFTCPCQTSYVGHTMRQLVTRAKEHAPDPKLSIRTRSNSILRDRIKGVIELHIDECEIFKEKFELAQGRPNTAKLKREDFLTEMFTILKSNLTNYYDRIISEAFFIKLLKPVLNVQVKHHSVKFL
jgi:hypothetical protein